MFKHGGMLDSDHFDAALAIDHFTDYRRFVKAVRAENGEDFVDRFGRARNQEATRSLRIGKQGLCHIV